MKQPSAKSQGFTLIEMMTVVAILAILSTLLIIGISKLQTNARRQQTTQTLENCRALWAEYDSAQRPHFDQFITYAPGNVSAEGADRFGLATCLTQSIFALMRTMPNIRAETDKYSGGRLVMPPTLTSSPLPAALPYSGSPVLPDVYVPGGTDQQTRFVSQQASASTLGTGEEYLCIHSVNNGSNIFYPSAPPPDPGSWLPVGGIPVNFTVAAVDTLTPVFLDGWGNPIICVIGGQLGSLASASGGHLISGGRIVTVNSPDNRLFWASAGPDGDFSKGDDNLYSFEKP